MLRRTRAVVRNLIWLVELNIKTIKEMFRMQFKEDSNLVKNAILLLTMGVYTGIEDVPKVGNLREVVERVLTK